MMVVEIDDNEYQYLLESIKLSYGYDFTEYAIASVKRRILLFTEAYSIKSMASLRLMLLGDEMLFEEFIQNLSITVTEMFRDPSFYLQLRNKVLPRLATYPVIKIWIAGCATGQEVYSVSIILKEEGLLDRAIIYATDINQSSLQKAKQGIYSLKDMKLYTRNYQIAGGREEFSNYYIAQHNSVLFDRSLSRNTVYSAHNLATDKSFNEFQLIVCRNVIIYFNPQLQHKVISLFYESLSPFGFLGLGDKESIMFSDKKHAFEHIDLKEKLYRRTN